MVHHPTKRPQRPIIISSNSSNPILRQLAQQIRRQNEEQQVNTDQVSSLPSSAVGLSGRADMNSPAVGLSGRADLNSPAVGLSGRADLNKSQTSAQKEDNIPLEQAANETVDTRTYAEVCKGVPSVATFAAKGQSAATLQQQLIPTKRDNESAFVSSLDGQQKPERRGSKPKKIKLSREVVKKMDTKRPLSDTESKSVPSQPPPTASTLSAEQPAQPVDSDNTLSPSTGESKELEAKVESSISQQQISQQQVIPAKRGSEEAFVSTLDGEQKRLERRANKVKKIKFSQKAENKGEAGRTDEHKGIENKRSSPTPGPASVTAVEQPVDTDKHSVLPSTTDTNQLTATDKPSPSYSVEESEKETVESGTNAVNPDAATPAAEVQSVVSQQQLSPRKRDSGAAFGDISIEGQQKPERPGSTPKKIKVSQVLDEREDTDKTAKQRGNKGKNVRFKIPAIPIRRRTAGQPAFTIQSHKVVQENTEQQCETESLVIQQRKRSNEFPTTNLNDNDNSGEQEIVESKETEEERVVKRRRAKGKEKETLEQQSEVVTVAEANTEVEEQDAQTIMQKLTREVQALQDTYRLVTELGEGSFSKVYLAEDLKHEDFCNAEWTSIVGETERLMKGSNTEQTSTSKNTSAESSKGYETAQEEKKSYVALKCIHSLADPKRMISELNILKKLKGSPCVTPLITAFRESGYVFFVMPYHEADDFGRFYYKLPMNDIKYYMKSLFQGLKALKENNIVHRDVKPYNFLYNIKKRTGFLIDFGLAEFEPPPEKPKKLNEVGTILINEIKAEIEEQPSKGYFEMDVRPSVDANRAGTRGFRAPEVLFRCTRHTCAVDIWAAGVILLSFLSETFPFFFHASEADAIMELLHVYGFTEMQEVAQKYGRTITTNISVPHDRISWLQIVEALNGPQFETWGNDGALALDLLEKCLHLDPEKRITAVEALAHPFFV